MEVGTVCSNENASNVSIVIITQVLESQRNRGMYGSISCVRRVSLPRTIIDRVGCMPGWMLQDAAAAEMRCNLILAGSGFNVS